MYKKVSFLLALLAIAVTKREALQRFATLVLPEEPGTCEIIEGTETPACHFSESYVEAREKFRTAAKAAGAAQHSLSIPLPRTVTDVPEGGLTIDIAVVEGRNDSVLIHMSGTHGVEGHAGSAIQVALLKDIAAGNIDAYSGSSKESAPTTVFVHAVNPFGFHYGRRWNENGVDLNRNCLLTDEEWESVLSRPRHFANYQNFSYHINPDKIKRGLSDFAPFFLHSAQLILQHGYSALMEAVVTGQYWKPDGIFYGGQELQPSHHLLQSWVEQNYGAATSAFVIDVHTGLGPQGMDTILLERSEHAVRAKKLFGNTAFAVSDASSGSDGTGNADGGAYTKMVGSNTMYHALPSAVAGGAYFEVTQEFGTLPGILVLVAMIQENVAYHQGTAEEKREFADLVRSAFYVRKATWKKEIVTRGVLAFEASLKDMRAQ